VFSVWGVEDALDVLELALDACQQARAWASSGSTLVERTDRLAVAAQRVVALQLAFIREVDGQGIPAEAGATSTVAWLRDRYRISGRAASRLVTLARALDVDADSPAAGALAAGQVNVEQATVITDAVGKLPVEHRRAGEEHLVGEAACFGPRELGRLGQRIFEVVAPAEADKQALDELERAERRAWHKRGLWLTAIPGSSDVRIYGVMTIEDAAVFQAATNPFCAPRTRRRPHRAGRAAGRGDAADPGNATGSEIRSETGGETGGDDNTGNAADVADLRPAGERRLDAAMEICRLACACGQLPDNGGDRPQIVVTIDYENLRRQVGAGTFDDGSHLSPVAARRIACDAGIIPAVLGSRSQPLDLGRQSRLVTGPLRRALVLRDGGCAFPGCDRPPRWCDAHHPLHWSDGGPTDLSNLVLLCGYHH
jgi:hypothetical protein